MKRYIIPFFLVVVLAAVVAYRMYNKPHRSVDEETALSISATELFNQFESDEPGSNAKYLDKVVEVTGVVSEVFKNQDGMQVIVLSTGNDMYGVSCTMETEQLVQKEEPLTVKGFCMGYLSDVVIGKAKIVNNK